MHIAAIAANRIPEFRMRVRDDGIVEYASCGTSHVVLLEDNTFCYCTLNHDMPYEEYIPYALKEQEACKQNVDLEDDEKTESLYFITSIPWLHYKHIVQAAACHNESNPRISWGKFIEIDERLMMPLTVLAHHAVVDGFHIGLFFKYVEEEMDRLILCG